jgi:hypothetical protein
MLSGKSLTWLIDTTQLTKYSVQRTIPIHLAYATHADTLSVAIVIVKELPRVTVAMSELGGRNKQYAEWKIFWILWAGLYRGLESSCHLVILNR